MVRVTHILEATVGGTARHLLDVGCGLAQAGFAVEALVSARPEEDFRDGVRRLREAGVSVAHVPMVREIHPVRDARALWRLARHLCRNRPAIVHTHSSKAGALGRLAALHAGVPVIVHSPHAFAFQMEVGATRRRVYRTIERVLARHTDCLVAVSHAEAEAAVLVGGYARERVVVIENGVRPEEAASPEEGIAVRRELGIPLQAPVVLFVGRLTPQKAPEVLVRAAARLLAGQPDAVFVVAGDGPLRPHLEREIARAGCGRGVRLLGRRDDTPRLYAAAQAFVLPSRWEGLPYALLDALRAGLPVVCTDIAPLREVVQRAGAGILVPPGDPEALSAALAQLLRCPERARSLGAAGRACVAQHYTLARQLEQLTALYRRLASSRAEAAALR